MRGRLRGVLPILDLSLDRPAELAASIARAWGTAGAQALQLRAKALSARDFLSAAQAVRAVTAELGLALYINDRPDIAVLVAADGVHLGQTDLPAAAVRAWLPANMAIGVSCHSVADVERAVDEGVADYLGFGPVFATSTKTNAEPVVGLAGLQAACARFPDTDIVAIGGITVERLPLVARAGAKCVAMISDLFRDPDLAQRYRQASLQFDAGDLDAGA